MDEETVEMAMRVLKPSRKRIHPGDIFVLQVKDGEFVFGRVIRTDIEFLGNNRILIYIYKAFSPEKNSIPELKKHRLLLPPMIIDRQPWSKGHFETVANRPLSQSDLLPIHCFHRDFFFADYYDADGDHVPFWKAWFYRLIGVPCGTYSLWMLYGIDSDIRAALLDKPVALQIASYIWNKLIRRSPLRQTNEPITTDIRGGEMDIDGFWSIVDSIKDSTQPEVDVSEKLRGLPLEEIVSFQEHMDRLCGQAYRWDLWGAAYIIQGGCSDDGFEYFRLGLISKGREVYEKALRDPDSLADFPVTSTDEFERELFGYAAVDVYEELTGEEMPRTAAAEDGFGVEPAGEQWDFDDKTECAKRLPRLTAKADELYAMYEKRQQEWLEQNPTPPKPPKKPWWKFW